MKQYRVVLYNPVVTDRPSVTGVGRSMAVAFGGAIEDAGRVWLNRGTATRERFYEDFEEARRRMLIGPPVRAVATHSFYGGPGVEIIDESTND